MSEPLPELKLPRLPPQQSGWSSLQVWWQNVVTQVERAVKAINTTITDVIAAQAAADAAQDTAIAAAVEAANAALDAASAQSTADSAVTDAATAQSTADNALALATAAVQQDVGPSWVAPTGTASRATFATFAGQTISASPTQAQVQAIDDHVKILSQRLKGIIDDLQGNGALK